MGLFGITASYLMGGGEGLATYGLNKMNGHGLGKTTTDLLWGHLTGTNPMMSAAFGKVPATALHMLGGAFGGGGMMPGMMPYRPFLF